jgi:hypothetical protein
MTASEFMRNGLCAKFRSIAKLSGGLTRAISSVKRILGSLSSQRIRGPAAVGAT